MDVDAVQEWAAYSGAVALNLSWSASAFTPVVSKIPAGAGIHGCHQHERAGECDFPCASGYGHLPVFQWLAKHFEGRAFKFRKLIEEEYAVMGEGNFAGSGDSASTEQAGIADGMMRSPEEALFTADVLVYGFPGGGVNV